MELDEGLSQESFISSLAVELVKERQKLYDNFFPLHNSVVEEPIEIHEQMAIRCKLMRARMASRAKEFQKMMQKKLQQMEKQKKLQQEEEVQQKNAQYLGFLLGVVVLFIYQYLMGYAERGQWNTYSNGAWEFRATYVCIELRLGSYPFQKFRERPGKFSGVSERSYNTKTGVTVIHKPWVWFKNRIFHFKGQKTAEKAARIRDVAKFWLKTEGRDPLNFGEKDYDYLNSVQEFRPQQSDHEIKKLVLEHAQRFLREGPIVDQTPDVGPAGFANAEHVDNTIEEFLPSDSDEINNMIQELHVPVDADEETTDMTEEP